MKDKNKLPATDSTQNKNQVNHNSLGAQRKRLIQAISEHGGLSTIQLREDHDIMQPAPRVHELRWNEGYNIHLEWTYDINAQGNRHRCGKYVLLPGQWKGGKHENV